MNKGEIKVIISKMTFSEKARLLTGDRGCTTTAYEKYGIPSVKMIDGPSGVRNDKTHIEGGNTAMPTASAIGASWDRELARLAGRTIANDCIEDGQAVLLGPGVNLKRSPHGGRNFEYYSEDPCLSGELGAAFINGLSEKGIGASLKHYAANNYERDCRVMNTEVDERTLREYYLKSFETALEKSSPVSVMNAYNKLNGIWCSENKWLLEKILREEWGYDGIVISDWGSVHDSARAINAGLTLEMPPNKDMEKKLEDGIKAGKVTMKKIDEACERMVHFADLVTKMQKQAEAYNRQKQHETARIAASECITLLKNTDNVLPVTNKKYKKIAVCGQLAKRPIIGGSGSSRVKTKDEMIDKPIDFISQYAKEENIELMFDEVYSDGYMGAEMIAKINDMQYNEYDAMIVFIGDNYGGDTETEYWDRDNITFTNYLNGIVNASCEVCENVIVVMQTGAATIPTVWHKRVKGIIQMWYAGEGGGKAIADILFGKTNPCGKLSETFILKDRTDIDYIGDGYKIWYKEGQFAGYRYYDIAKEDVWFPFGHGLSYTSFSYDNLKLSKKFSDNSDNILTVTVDITNTGDVSGKEVVQLYVGQKDAVVMRPKKELRGFSKIELKPKETKTVSFILSKKDFAYYNTMLKKWHVESGIYTIFAAASASDIRISADYEILNKDDYTKGGRKGKLVMA